MQGIYSSQQWFGFPTEQHYKVYIGTINVQYFATYSFELDKTLMR